MLTMRRTAWRRPDQPSPVSPWEVGSVLAHLVPLAHLARPALLEETARGGRTAGTGPLVREGQRGHLGLPTPVEAAAAAAGRATSCQVPQAPQVPRVPLAAKESRAKTGGSGCQG